MYRVIIIEDDPMVAAINRQYAEAEPGFRVEKIFKSGADALSWLEKAAADLIILDYYMPLMTGKTFIDRLHAMGKAPSIIMVTSAGETDIIQELISRGVMDYLVKPFEQSRFRQALKRFKAAKTYLGGAKSMDQGAIDQLIQGPRTEAPLPPLAKGLNEATLALVRKFLAAHPGEAFSSEEIAEQVKLSRITIRRYMNYMVEIGEAASSIDYQTGGRPSIRYVGVGKERGGL